MPLAAVNNDERIFHIADELQGVVDAIVGGRSHAGVAHFAGQVPIVQAFSYGIAFGRMTWFVASPMAAADRSPGDHHPSAD